MALGRSSSYSLEEISDVASPTSPASPSLNPPGYTPYRSCRIRKKARRSCRTRKKKARRKPSWQPSWCASSSSSSSSSRSSRRKSSGRPLPSCDPEPEKKPLDTSAASSAVPAPPQPAKPETPAEASQKAVPLQIGRLQRSCPTHLLPRPSTRPIWGPLPVGVVQAPKQVPAKHPPSKATVVQARPKQVSATAPPQSQPECA